MFHSAVLLSKYRLKCAVTIHVLLVLVMAFRLSVALYVMAGVRPPRTLQKLRLPASKNWELVWLLGNVVTCLIGVISLLRNRPTLVRFYAAGASIRLMQLHPTPIEVLLMMFFTARCTIVQSAVLRLQCRPSVCLSVCLSVRL